MDDVSFPQSNALLCTGTKHDVGVGFQITAERKSRSELTPPAPMTRREDALLSCRTGAALRCVDYMRGRVQSAIDAVL